MQKPSVFISSSAAGLNAARELARQIESFATVMVWPEGAFEPGKTTFESLTEVADRSDFAVFLLTANDVVHSRGFSRRIPSDNVVFELGFLAGRLGINRTFIVSEHNADPRLPSDIAGVAYLKFKTTQQKDFSVALAPVAAAIRRTIQKFEPRAQKPVDYYSCFISYSWRDKDFATQLHDDLREVGVRCWLDAKDISPGAVIADEIDKAIQAHDKVLLVLSKDSIRSDWVKHEIRNTLKLEAARRKTVLFPLRLDDAVFTTSNEKEIDSVKQKLIVDFTNWKEKAEYRRAFKSLVQSIAIIAAVESGGQR